MLFLTELAPHLWTATQPLRFMGLEVGCRMTVVRLPSGDLVLISPIKLHERDRATLDALGTVRHIVAPNQFHYLFMENAQALYPEAKVWGVPALADKQPHLFMDALFTAAGHFEETLEYTQFHGLAVPLPTGATTIEEVIFYHRPSRTLILTDAAFNFDETFPFRTRLAAQVLGSYKALRPSRLERWVSQDKAAIETSVRQVLRWEFERVIPGHGTIVETDGKRAFQAGYEWFLGRSLT